jgi:hypothetical protein
MVHNNSNGWNVVTYSQQGSSGPVIDGITQFLNILMGPAAFSTHVATAFLDSGGSGNYMFSGAVFYVPGLINIPNTSSLSSAWSLYESPSDAPGNVYQDVTSFINTNLTPSQGFYGKLTVSQTTYLNQEKMHAFFWYRNLVSDEEKLELGNKAVHSTTWAIKTFKEDADSDIANIFTQVLDGLGPIRSQCAHVASSLYLNPYIASEAYGGALIPGSMIAIPNATMLNGNWFVHTETAEPDTAFQNMQKFLGNLTDSQICYGKLAFTTDSSANINSTVSFWYQGISGEHSDHGESLQ